MQIAVVTGLAEDSASLTAMTEGIIVAAIGAHGFIGFGLDTPPHSLGNQLVLSTLRLRGMVRSGLRHFLPPADWLPHLFVKPAGRRHERKHLQPSDYRQHYGGYSDVGSGCGEGRVRRYRSRRDGHLSATAARPARMKPRSGHVSGNSPARTLDSHHTCEVDSSGSLAVGRRALASCRLQARGMRWDSNGRLRN
jgi:hypothetical protein